ncbi:MAG: bifunctional diaminohydroxyphosphoribosylaminopyrimidine deaminase/5-amino-6-(5-phosphoribosylamino)uracil reductase RibD [Verrucomicrobiota bacterium]|nr:bifunctional diaminohydroxyphosphoribosylaminopyrimidine deaminase/5-amino-6-(5-phosphoribosylamino)uracil reductase RibD [Verrucomicrobiota bacterium]
MRGALAEARKGLGLTSPNPAVGALLVRRGQVLARGHHRGVGHPHAEIECLRALGNSVPKQATLYVTLEPCSTVGRTPPCTSALIEAGVRRVVVGAVDVNPAHAGRGLEILRAAGVQVEAGLLAEECGALNVAFNKWIRQKRPFVIAKCGMTLDGRLTRPPNEPRAITSLAARTRANHFRAQVDAVIIGAETLRSDNPRLTVRGVRGARQPWRVVLTRSGRLPKSAHLFTDKFSARTIVFRKQPLVEVLDSLGEREITSVLIEGGGQILGEALEARLIDRVHIYLAPILAGGPVLAFPGSGAGATNAALCLRDVRYERIGRDVLVIGDATYPNSLGE